MTTRFRVASAFVVVTLAVAANDPPKSDGLQVTDAAGKEHKVKTWALTVGTRPLGWLAKGPPKKADDDEEKKPAGPQALVVRDEMKIHFVAGVTTLVPVERLRAVEFDKEKETMTVRVAVSAKPEDDVVLTGTTAYKGINKVTLTAEVDKGEAGVASLTYQGGVPKGVKAIRFPAPKVEKEKEGRPAVVVTREEDARRAHKVTDLMPLYQLKNGSEKLLPTLMFHKTLKLDVAKVKSVAAGDDLVWQVVQKDGDDSSLTLLTSVTLEGGPATLVGLVGKTAAGYKLFPPKRVHQIAFDTTEEPKEKE